MISPHFLGCEGSDTRADDRVSAEVSSSLNINNMVRFFASLLIWNSKLLIGTGTQLESASREN